MRPDYSVLVPLHRISSGPDTPLNLAATAALWAGYAVHAPLTLNRVSFLVTTAVTAGSVAGQVHFVRYPTYASTTGSVALGTLTIPNAASVGQVYYKDLSTSASTSRLNAGEELAVWIGRQCVDAGTAAGAGFPAFSYDPAPEYVANQTNMVASA